MEAKRHKYSKQYCPHWDKEVSKSTWYDHYARFFNTTNKKWDKPAAAAHEKPFDFENVELSDKEGEESLPQQINDEDSEEYGWEFKHGYWCTRRECEYIHK